MTTPDLRCWNCGTSLAEVPRPISRHEHCPSCFEALHCCRLCRHYQSDASITCDEERADPPVHKENANFCDYFRPRSGAYVADRGEQSEAARAKLDALFGADTPEETDNVPDSAPDASIAPSKADAAKAKLDSLFSKDS